MNIPTEFNGNISFFLKIKCEHGIGIGNIYIEADAEWMKGSDDYLFLGETEVSVNFLNTENAVEKIVEGLQAHKAKQVQKHKSAIAKIIAETDDKISKLLALPGPEAA